MFKRTRKITALMIAVASIISMVPASADTVYLGDADGSIEKAVPFMDGTYLYKGSKESTGYGYGVYYYNGKEDILLDDIDELGDSSDDLGTKFGHQYAIGKDEDGDDRLIDLLNGEATKDSVSDSMDNAQRKLLKKLKGTKRYSSSMEITKFEQIQKDTFNDIWYYYEADTGKKDSDGNSIIYSGYVNDLGDYIDCSKIANISLFNGTRMVDMEEFDEEKTVDGTKMEVAIDYDPIANGATADYNMTLGQDSDYIYREVRVKTDGHKSYSSTTTVASYTYFIQKISKAQGEEDHDVYYPKEVTSYELTSNTSISDVDSAVSYLQGHHIGSYILGGNIIEQEYYTDTSSSTTQYTARTSKIGLVTNKVTLPGTSKSLDVNLARKQAYNTQSDILDTNAVVLDATGDIWCINKYGEIKKAAAGGSFSTVYSVNPDFNRLSVYDSNNLLSWEDGGDKFTSIQEGKTAALDEANETIKELTDSGVTFTDINKTTTSAAVTTKTGWDKLEDGTMNFYDEKGNKVLNKWVNVGGNAYYLKEDGVMATGWLNDNKNWYYLNTDGSMKIGWLNDSGNWYFMQPSGIMKNGWLKDNGKWCYLDETGVMLSNTTIDGYTLDGSGALVK